MVLTAGNAEPAARRELPATLVDLVRDTGSAIDRAERLQLLAALTPDADAEQLWQRSLIALRGMPANDELATTALATTFRARAYFHLHRRPYGTELLRGLTSGDARALSAIIDGNLGDAEQRAAELRSPIAALIAAVEFENLRERYGKTAGFRARCITWLRFASCLAPISALFIASLEIHPV